MGITRKEMKQTAKNGIRSARPRPAWVTLVYVLLTTGLSLAVPGILLVLSGGEGFFYWLEKGYSVNELMYYYMGAAGAAMLLFTNILIGLFGEVLTFGYTGYTLGVARGKTTGYASLLYGFGLAGRVILLNLLIGIFTALWSMLFLIPGIVAAYSYRMAVYILLDNPDCGVLEAIRTSKAMMKGQKANLLVFDLSFFNCLLPFIVAGAAGALLSGYYFFPGMALIYICSAILSLWAVPYYLTSQAVFYDTISDSGIRSRLGDGYSGPEIRF